VAVRSVLHLGQIQVGLAEPIRVCQGSDIDILLPHEVPFEKDGEPSLLKPCTMRISHKCRSLVLTPSVSNNGSTTHAIEKVLLNAERGGIISNFQRNFLLKEFSNLLR